ncbi:MAG: metallophosphoesterase [Chloroflexota bacterium]
MLDGKHVGFQQFDPEDGVSKRIDEAIERESARTELPDYVRDFIQNILDEQRTNEYPYPSTVQAARALVSAINNLKAPIDFVLHTGDIAQQGTPVEYDLVREIFESLESPIHYVNGNHDNVESLYSGLLRLETSTEPYDYTFEMNGVAFICVDSATSGVGTDWHLSDEQLAWLESQIAATDDRPLVIAIHHPPYQIFHDAKDYFMLRNADAVHGVLKAVGPRLRGVFSGHVHYAMNRMRDGVFYSVAPKPYSYIPGFSIVTVTDDGILVDRHRF